MKMHIPTPTVHRASSKKQKENQKRKASASSSISDSSTPASKKVTKKTKTIDPATEADVQETQDSKAVIPQSHRKRGSSITEMGRAMFSTHSSSPPDQTQTQTHSQLQLESSPSLRRSSRIKQGAHKCSETWYRCRPYLERINGTIMPLEHQGTGAGAKGYYQKDGVKM